MGKMSKPEPSVSQSVAQRFKAKYEKPEPDAAADKKRGIVEGSKRDEKMDKKAKIKS